jgi:hypothetical protein
MHFVREKRDKLPTGVFTREKKIEGKARKAPPAGFFARFEYAATCVPGELPWR